MPLLLAVISNTNAQHCCLDPKLLGGQKEQEYKGIFPHCILEQLTQAQLTVHVARLICFLAIFKPSEGH